MTDLEKAAEAAFDGKGPVIRQRKAPTAESVAQRVKAHLRIDRPPHDRTVMPLNPGLFFVQRMKAGR